MTDEKPAVYGRLESRSLAVLTLTLSLAFALPGEVSAKAWELEREKGVGGGAAAAPAAPAVPRKASQNKAGDEKTRAAPPTASELLEQAEPQDQPRRSILPPADTAPSAASEVAAVQVILPSPPKPAQRDESVQPISQTAGDVVSAPAGVRKAVSPERVTGGSLRSAALATDDAVADTTAATADGEREGATVDIHVHFIEASRSAVKNLGIDWDVLVDSSGFRFGRSTGNVDDVGMDAFIGALARREIVDVLAEPDLNSIGGEPAKALAGGEIPLLVPGEDGSTTATIDDKPIGVSLDIVPTVLADERIDLRVRPEVSSISSDGAVVVDGFPVPAFTVRHAESIVELAHGQTVAIAGLFQHDRAPDIDAFPALGDLPVLGELFRSERFQRAETELVVLITPYLIEPAGSRDIAVQ